MKQKEIKLYLFIIVLILFFGIFLFLIFKSYDYEKSYIINKFKITEKYNKKDKYYTFYIKNENITYSYLIKSKYFRKKELINEIKLENNKEEICILPVSEIIEFYPLCSNDDSIYTYNLSNTKKFYSYKELNEINKEYNKINIYNYNDLSFLIYNYKGFYLINEDKEKNIKLFNNDVYSIDLIYQKENYLIVPNYNQNYYFNKIYIVNIKNGKFDEIEFDYDISFESIFLGDYKNNIYLLDKKEEKEYRINLKKKKIELIDFQILKDNKMIKSSYKDIIKNNLTFPTNNLLNYEIIDGTLYLITNNSKIKITNKTVDKIIKNNDESIYYLSGESLYMYNNLYGEILLLSNFEWNFNNTNIIYLYK